MNADDVCSSCGHYRAYHDGSRPCRAWNPDEKDGLCACKGWTDPQPAVAADHLTGQVE